MKEEEMKRKPAYRDGLDLWTEGESFTAPGGEIVEVLYDAKTGGKKSYFVELPGIPACAHGSTIEDAINDAREKRKDLTPLTEEEKKEYRAENFRFSVELFRRITKACQTGIQLWLDERGLDKTVTMTLREFREAGGGVWADALENKLK